MAMLKQQYPARLMPQLVQSSQATLQVSLYIQSPLARSFLAGQQMETKLQPLVHASIVMLISACPLLASFDAMIASLPAISCTCFSL